MTGAHPAPGLTRPDGSPLRVLVVDDDVNIAELLAMALRYEGWQVSMAHTGSRAVAAAKDDRPDAVVLDVMLPDFDGGEVLRRMRGHHPDVPALFLTARDAVEDRSPGSPQQLELGGGQPDLVVPAEDLVAVLVEAEVAHGEHRRRTPVGGTGPPHQGPQPGDDLLEAEGLGDVVVAAGGKEPVGLGAAAHPVRRRRRRTGLVRRQMRPLQEVATTAHEVAALPLDTGEIGRSTARPAQPGLWVFVRR